MRLRNIFYISILFFFSSCFEEDERVTPHEPGEVETATIAQKQDYSQTVFFDLGNGDGVLETGKMAWDLALESQAGGWRIYLNTTRFMLAARTAKTDFDSVTDTLETRWRFDKSDGNPDSTAIGKWFDVQNGDTLSRSEVYIINLGYSSSGNPLGLRKLQLTDYDGESYTLVHARLDGSEYTENRVVKDPGMPLVFYSLRNKESIAGQWPSPGSWDLWFTQYTTLLYTNAGDPYPYIVTGVLANIRDGVEVAKDTAFAFSELDFDVALSLNFSREADMIGYDWKWYDFDAGSYTVLTKVNYVIKTTEGYFYKLRFIGFYNTQGEKGYPVIEYQRL
jgi:hypothetical protein